MVFDGKYVTAAGVSAGIDMALTLAGRAPAAIVSALRARSRFILTGRPT